MSELPPPAEGPSPPPIPLTSFVGRDRDIATVTDLLHQPDIRLLTLTGPGGMGKTRLALRIMETVHAASGLPSAWVALAPIRDPDLVLPTIAQVLQVPDAAERSLLDRVTTFLTECPMLLVLDNLEHLVAPAASLVADLLARCPGLRVLATSRVRLGISGEHVVPVAPLEVETARALFAQRVRAADPTFAITSENVSVIDAICDRLDRLPLAIELAAARVTVLPLPALLARLDHRLDLLTGGPRDAPSRQRTVRDTIAWSLDLLDEPEQRLYRRLGIFVGGFTLDAVEVVAGEHQDVLTGVSTLVTASLVIPAESVGNEARLTMLETIREDALERLGASGEEATIQEAHARYFVALAEQWWEGGSGGAFDTWMHHLRSDIGNLRLALAWTLAHEPASAVQLAGALAEYWPTHGPLAEGQAWITRALQAAPDAPPRDRARALLGLGWITRDQGDLNAAETVLTEAIALARDIFDDESLTRGGMFLGQIALDRGDLERAHTLLREAHARAVASVCPQPVNVAILTQSLGQVALATGDLATAQSLLEEALAQHQAASGSIGVAFGQLYLGQALLVRGQQGPAVDLLRAALSAFLAVGAHGSVGTALEGLASAARPHQPVTAVRLLAVAAANRDHLGRVREWLDETLYGQLAETLRTTLGDTAFEAAWEAGRTLIWSEVLAEVDAMVATLPTSATSAPDAPPAGLTPRETEVLRLLAEGRSNRAIGEALSISERTVENHVLHILTKLDLDSRTAAAAWAVRHGLA
jgi:non-specific serine/threonine protein kinase